MKYISAVFFLFLLAASLGADTITTQDGATIVGKITSIESGKVTISTSFAGSITVDQKQVQTLQIDEALNIRLNDQTKLTGTVSTDANGNLQIRSDARSHTSSISNISTVWPKDAVDPQIAALQRKWDYEIAADITGKSGNSHEFGSAISGRAKLTGPQDTFLLYANYDRKKTDGSTSSDQFRGGIDYQLQFSDRLSWFVRNEAGYDKVKGIDFYDIAAAGIGYHFIKQPKHTLIGRTGLSYRYESYQDTMLKEDLNSLGLDFELSHEWSFEQSRIVNNITYTPAFESIHEYRIFHESFYEVPLSASLWKFRIGISNDYNANPGTGKDRLDTTYFARLVFTWN